MNAREEGGPEGDSPAPADSLASRLLDEPLDAAVPYDELTVADRQRIADLQWLDALLEHAQGNQREAVNSALASVLSRLGQDSVEVAPSPPRTRRFGARRSMMSLLAASVLLVLFGVVWWRQPRSAYAMVEQAYQAALRPIDMTYQVIVSSEGAEQPVRTGTLTVRGGEKFVFDTTGPLGGRITFGGDGREFWFVPPLGPALTADSELFVRRWLHGQQTELPFLHLTTILARLNNRYDLVALDAEALDGRGPVCDRVRATRRDAAAADNPRLPEAVELWVNRESGRVERLIVTRAHELAPGRQTLTFNLTSVETREAGFYESSTYVGKRRPGARMP